jgi:hypothetical protein
LIDGIEECLLDTLSYLMSGDFLEIYPIVKIDPDGNDLIFSTSKDKDGNLVINLTYYTAVMNSSRKNIDMKKFMAN